MAMKSQNLGMTLDAKLQWKEHVRKELKIKLAKIN